MASLPYLPQLVSWPSVISDALNLSALKMSLPLLPSNPINVANLIDAIVGTFETSLNSAFSSAINTLQTTISVAVTNAINAAITVLSAEINLVLSAINGVVSSLTTLINGISSTVTGLVNTALGAVQTVVNDILLFLQKILNDVRQELAMFRYIFIIGIVVLLIIGGGIFVSKLESNRIQQEKLDRSAGISPQTSANLR